MSSFFRAKYIGGMIGSALGDAIGEIAYRYRERRLLCAQINRAGKLSYTDDTAMAIGLAESIIKMRRIDQEDLGKTFHRNYAREPSRGYAPGPPTLPEGVKKLNFSRHPGENRGPVNS